MEEGRSCAVADASGEARLALSEGAGAAVQSIAGDGCVDGFMHGAAGKGSNGRGQDADRTAGLAVGGERRAVREDKEPRTVAGLHNRCPGLGIQTTRPPPYSHPPLAPSLPPRPPSTLHHRRPPPCLSRPPPSPPPSPSTAMLPPRHNQLRAKCASTSVRANFLRLLPLLMPPGHLRLSVPGARRRRRGRVRDCMLGGA